MWGLCRRVDSPKDSFYLEVPFDTREDEALFAVFDGHGANGKTVAEVRLFRARFFILLNFLSSYVTSCLVKSRKA